MRVCIDENKQVLSLHMLRIREPLAAYQPLAVQAQIQNGRPRQLHQLDRTPREPSRRSVPVLGVRKSLVGLCRIGLSTVMVTCLVDQAHVVVFMQ